MQLFKIFGTTLGDKTRILVFNIASGLLSLAIVSFVYHFSLKYDYDTLFIEYSQSIIALEETRKIINASQNFLAQKDKIPKIKEEILQQWEVYQTLQNRSLNESSSNSFLRTAYHLFGNDDSVLQKKLQLQDDLKQLDQQIHIYLQFLAQEFNQQSLQKISSNLNHKISDIIYANLQFVEAKKARNNVLHSILQTAILVIMCLIILITILLSFLILRNIKNLHATLEEKVKEKTKELQNLNNSLQETIKKEVLANQQKDQIMYQQARLASMGEMIGNIAHQWRQPLNALTLLIQAFKIKSQNGKLTQDFIDIQVEDGLKIAKRMSQTIEDFRNFFNSTSDKELFNLKENIEDSISLVDAFLKQNEINIFVDCADDIELFGYKSAFSQVILNLIKNSEDVLKSRAVFPATIRIIVSKEDNKCKESDSKQWVRILFMDNGGGIKLDDIQKIFEPYFTTKHKSVGTGIGLYMSKQIIEKQMQGSIEVRNVFCDDAFNSIREKCAQDCKLDCATKTEICGAQFIIKIPLKETKSD